MHLDVEILHRSVPHVIGMGIVGVRQRCQIIFQHVVIVGQIVVILEQSGITLGQRLDDLRRVLPVQLNQPLELRRQFGWRGGRDVGFRGRVRWMQKSDAAQALSVFRVEIVGHLPRRFLGRNLEPHNDVGSDRGDGAEFMMLLVQEFAGEQQWHGHGIFKRAPFLGNIPVFLEANGFRHSLRRRAGGLGGNRIGVGQGQCNHHIALRLETRRAGNRHVALLELFIQVLEAQLLAPELMGVVQIGRIRQGVAVGDETIMIGEGKGFRPQQIGRKRGLLGRPFDEP